ncbi:MAG: transcriptional regulator [Dermatophilaceae bacterium]
MPSTHPDRCVPGAVSPPDLLTLHALRLTGWPSADAVASWTALDRGLVAELLEDDEARGFVLRSTYGGRSGWSLTDRGRVEDERRLAQELRRTQAREAVERAHESFLPLNERLLLACTRWQLRPVAGDPLAANDHTDWRWDQRVLDELGRVEVGLAKVCAELAVLRRFDGYLVRFANARALASRGELSWVDRPDADSCHTVWIQLHEDLLSTLGLHRGPHANPGAR